MLPHGLMVNFLSVDDMLQDELLLAFDLWLELVDLTLDGFDRPVGAEVRLVLRNLLHLLMSVLLLDQEALYFLPALVPEDGHG